MREWHVSWGFHLYLKVWWQIGHWMKSSSNRKAQLFNSFPISLYDSMHMFKANIKTPVSLMKTLGGHSWPSKSWCGLGLLKLVLSKSEDSIKVVYMGFQVRKKPIKILLDLPDHPYVGQDDRYWYKSTIKDSRDSIFGVSSEKAHEGSCLLKENTWMIFLTSFIILMWVRMNKIAIILPRISKKLHVWAFKYKSPPFPNTLNLPA